MNNDDFSSSEVVANVGKAQAGLSSSDINDRFLVAFSIPELPRTGTFQLNTSEPGQICAVNFYVHGKFYYSSPSQIGYLNASEVDGKAVYTLAPTWFVFNDSPTTDSVLISGEFNEP